MKLKKKIAAMGAAVMIMASMSAIGASAYQASYEDSYRIILAYTSYTPSETDSVGTGNESFNYKNKVLCTVNPLLQDFCSKNRFLYSFWMEKWYAVQRSAFESNNNP